MRKTWIAALAVFVLVVAACGGDDDTSDTTATTQSTETTQAPATTAAPGTTAAPDTTAAPEAGADLNLATTDLGDILVDAAGNTIYLFVPDAQGVSTCYDQCEENWPVLSELASIGDGLDAGLLGTTDRDDGNVQATYNGWPLYYFANDAAAGDTNGQGVGDVWYVMDAAGNGIGAP